MKTMRACFSIFRIRMAEGLQYRASAVSGLIVGVFWALIECIVFTVFFTHADSNWNTNGMTLSNTISYVWVSQALFALQFGTMDGSIREDIISGNIGIELCRPLDTYFHWWFKSASGKLGLGWIRLVFILFIGFLMPFGYALSAPADVAGFFMFLLSACLAFILSVSYVMLVTAVRISITWGDGPTYMMMLAGMVLSGSYLPLRLWPDFLQGFLRYQPFGGLTDIPVQLYTGTISVKDAFPVIAVQIVWIVFFVTAGRLVMRSRLKNIVVQGG